MGFEDEREEEKNNTKRPKAAVPTAAQLSHADDESISEPEAEHEIAPQVVIEDKPEIETRYQDLVKESRNVIGSGLTKK